MTRRERRMVCCVIAAHVAVLVGTTLYATRPAPSPAVPVMHMVDNPDCGLEGRTYFDLCRDNHHARLGEEPDPVNL